MPTPRAPLRCSPAANAATAAILLLAIVGILLSAQLHAPTASGPEPAAVAVYAERDDGSLQRLDPDTLADLPDGARSSSTTPSPLGGPASADIDAAQTDWLASNDGSTIVRVVTDYSGDGTVPIPQLVVFDAASGAERTTFALPYPFNNQTAPLTADGHHLIVRENVSSDDLHPPWHVIDTETGRAVRTIRSSEPTAFPEFDGGLPRIWDADALGRRLYHLASAKPREGTAPVSMALVAYDLTTGAKIDIIEMPAVRAGTLERTQTAGAPSASTQVPIEDFLVPTLDLSTDGQRLVVVNGDGTAITLIEAATLTVEKPISLANSALMPVAERLEPASEPPDRGGNPLASGRYLFPTFTADGRHLYLSGVAYAVSPEGRQIVQDLGLLRIDLETGSLLARASIAIAPWIVQSNDGSHLYAISLEPRNTAGFSIVLRRLDPETLATIAKREGQFDPSILVVPDRAERATSSSPPVP